MRCCQRPAQGAVGIEIRSADTATRELVAKIHDEATGIAVTAERAFLACLDGSCRTPIAALATVSRRQAVDEGHDPDAGWRAGLRDLARRRRQRRRGPRRGCGAGASEAGRKRRVPPCELIGASMRLLVTRPEPDAAALAEELRALGHEPVVQPLLEFHALDFDPAPVKTAGALIVTSRNGLRALQGRIDPAGIAGCPVFCVGGETERGLRQAGFQAIAGVAETAEQLGRGDCRNGREGHKSRPCHGRASGLRSRGGAGGARVFHRHAARLRDEGGECFRWRGFGCVEGRQHRRRHSDVAAHGGDFRFLVRAARLFGSRKVPRLLLLSEKCVK